MDRERFAMALLRRICLSLVLFALFTIPVARAVAQSDVYTVRDVAVDVTGDTATQARAAALPEAYKQAFGKLVARLVPQGERPYVPDMEAARLEQMVRDFEVEEERASAVRYIAELTVRFQPDAVQQFLRNSGVRYAVTRSKPLVVLPVYGGGNEAVLWDEPNPWRQAWMDYPSDAGLVPMIVPLGDLGDMASINARDALAGDRDGMSSVASNYGAEGAVVARAEASGDAEAGSARIDVVARWYDLASGGTGQQVTDSLRQSEGESLEDLLYRGAESVAEAINESWKQANLLSFQQYQSIIAEVPLDGLRRWREVRRSLAGVSMIDGVDLRALNRRAALVEVSFFGDVGQLQLALSQQDLSLSSDAAMGIWRIASFDYPGTSGSFGGSPTTESGSMQEGSPGAEAENSGAGASEAE
jgi:hypothetical protein